MHMEYLKETKAPMIYIMHFIIFYFRLAIQKTGPSIVNPEGAHIKQQNQSRSIKNLKNK